MAITSSSASIPPPPRSCTYHVFLSFRGEDTRTGFSSHLYAALNRKGITTYKDDKNLRKGDVISDELLKAIEESMFAVIVFSPDYASSSWCLDELCKIIECKNKLGLQIEAVFYGVKPCDVRHQIGTFEEAFKKHEQRHNTEKVKRWRDALKQVADYSGWSSKSQEEAALVENIAQHIHEILIPKLSSSMKDLVGIDSRVEQVISHIDLGSNDVRYIGIWGMGGIGKTTIARAVFEMIRSRFEVSCFLADIREQCEKKNTADIQKQLLNQMNISSAALHSKYDGTTIIQTSLCLRKVLLVLDDVNHKKQLENLAGEKDWFGSGSRIIITTRDIHLLKEQDVHETYKVDGLVESEAFNLFCSKAFKQPKPTREFLDLSKEVVKYSGGLPLALKVLGSHLYNRSIEVWHSAIEEIKRSSHSEIIDVLKISYDRLGSMERDLFLDIACFFKGYKKDDVSNIFKNCGYDAEIGIATLIDRSLVTLERDWRGEVVLGMHDLVEEMGKLIVIQESPKDASKRSRLWCYEDVDFVLTQKKETKTTQSIVLHNMSVSINEEHWRGLAFSNICQLMLLILDRVRAPILCNIPISLRVLRWTGCPMETLPLTDQHYKLVGIDLSSSKIVQLWEGKKFLERLKHLDMSWCINLKRTPDLSGAPYLETLDLAHCQKLNDIHPSLVHHKSLVVLNLQYCSSLETLGDKLEMRSLEKLNLYECTSLRKLPEFGKCMKQLSILTLSYTGIQELPATLENLAGLSELYLGGCELNGLPISLGCFVGLKKLELSGCGKISCLPYNSHGLESLTVSTWSDSPNIAGLLCSLPGLTSLTSLGLHGCFPTSKESTLYRNLGGLMSLEDLNLSRNEFPVPISIHELPRLRHLNLNRCHNLEVLPELPSSLRELHVSDCKSWRSWKNSSFISEACCVFAESASQDDEDLLQIFIPGSQIPAWFVHQEKGNGVSVPFPHNCPSNKTMALALCFVLEAEQFLKVQPSVICNSKEFIKKSLFQVCVGEHSQNVFIVCLTRYNFSNLLRQHSRFQILFSGYHAIKVHSSGARWVYKRDIQGFKKIPNSKKKSNF